MENYITNEMPFGVWLPVKKTLTVEQVKEIKKLIDQRFGWDKFYLELNWDYSKVRKIKM